MFSCILKICSTLISHSFLFTILLFIHQLSSASLRSVPCSDHRSASSFLLRDVLRSPFILQLNRLVLPTLTTTSIIHHLFLIPFPQLLTTLFPTPCRPHLPSSQEPSCFASIIKPCLVFCLPAFLPPSLPVTATRCLSLSVPFFTLFSLLFPFPYYPRQLST